MRTGSPLFALLLVLGCATPLSELPYCAERLEPASTPITACRNSKEAQAYEVRLAEQILQRSQWQYPGRTPLRVRMTSESRVGVVCMGTAGSPPGWSDRDRVAASLRDLRRVEPGPACLAGTTLDLTGTLVQEASGLKLDEFGHRMLRRCVEFLGSTCENDQRRVCGVFGDGERRDFRNHCAACATYGVDGFVPGRCPPR